MRQFNYYKLDPFYNQVIESKEVLERTNAYIHLDVHYIWWGYQELRAYSLFWA
jgi:hypothetical protein